MELEKNLNDEAYLIGISSQKKGRFIIQEIEEENNKTFFSPKKYSFDSRRVIFSYLTYDNNSNFLNQTDHNNSKGYIINKPKSNKDLNEMEKRSRAGSSNSKKEIVSNFPQRGFDNLIDNNEYNINTYKRKTSEENYFSGENNNNYNNNAPIQIKTYVLRIEDDENYQFLDFEIIWRQFIERNKVNLYNNLDKRIFCYHKLSQDKMQLMACKKSSSFLSSDQRSQKSQDTQYQKIEKQISHSSLKKLSRYNSEIKTLTNKNQINNSKNELRWSQNLEKIEKRTLSGERMSIFKRNSLNTFCSSFSKKMINLHSNNFNNNNATNENQKQKSTLKTAFSNKNILGLHSNFKSDLEINYGFEENEDTEENLKIGENKKLPLKKLSEKEIFEACPLINKTEAESFKGKLFENLKIDGKSKSKETECEVNIDIISSEMDSDSKKTENKLDDYDENKSNKKSIFYRFDNGTRDDQSNDELCGENENDILHKFHSHGVNLDIKKRIFIEDDLTDRGSKGKLSMESDKNKVDNDKSNCFKEEQESDLFIPKINFDSDKNLVSDVNPFLKLEGGDRCNLNHKNNNKKASCISNQLQEKLKRESVFENELNEVNVRNAKKRSLANENNHSNSNNNNNYNNNLEDLLKSPLEALMCKDREKNLNNKKYKSGNLNLDMKSIENSSQYLHKKDFYPINRLSLAHSSEKNHHDIFALEEEEDHFYYSCSSINTPKSKALVVKNQQYKKLSVHIDNRQKLKIKRESAKEDFALKKNKTSKIKFSDLSNKGEKNKQNSIPNIPTNTIPKNDFNSNKLNNRINFDVSKKFKNSNNPKLNIIKSIQKSFVEDEKQKISALISRINSVHNKFNCVKPKKNEIEKKQFEILPSIIKSDPNDLNKDHKLEESKEEEEEEEESDSYENLQVVQEISIELCREKNKFINKFEYNNNNNKENFCKECKCKQV